MRTKLNSRWACGRPAGFTMVEIAIALAVIAFALVAIIGILPSGMQVQQDNLEETIINQDGNYWVEAIRTGSLGLEELLDHVESVNTYTNGTLIAGHAALTPMEIVGLLSTPTVTNEAVVRAISGSAAEAGSDLAFRYKLRTEIRPFEAASSDPRLSSKERAALRTNLFELRLEFRWPIFPAGDTGSGRKVFRELVQASVVQTNSPNFSSLYILQSR